MAFERPLLGHLTRPEMIAVLGQPSAEWTSQRDHRCAPTRSWCNVAQRLVLAVDRATAEQPSLKNKRVSPHTLRHSTAMYLLQSGVPFNVIALWLGHESTNTTHRYVEANLEMKEKALAKLEAPDIKLKRFRATDELMKFLQDL